MAKKKAKKAKAKPEEIVIGVPKGRNVADPDFLIDLIRNLLSDLEVAISNKNDRAQETLESRIEDLEHERNDLSDELDTLRDEIEDLRR